MYIVTSHYHLHIFRLTALKFVGFKTVQWHIVRAYEPAKVNLNRIVLAYPVFIHVNCPGNDNDIADAAARLAAAVDLFRRQCPLGAFVEEVIPIRGRGRKKCAWRVRYIRDIKPEFIQISDKQLELDIMNRQPNNTIIIENSRCVFPSFIELVYSCRCQCKVSRRANMSIEKCDFVVNIKVEENLANLKLEKDPQE